MGKETRNTAATSNSEDVEQLINKVCASFVKQIEAKFDKKLDQINDKLSKVTDSLNEIKETVGQNKKSISDLDSKIDYLEQLSKKNALRFHGFQENPEEEVADMIVDFIINKLNITCTKENIDCAFRVGQSLHDKPRSILVNFTSNIKRHEIITAKKNKLKGSKIAIYEDLTKPRYELLQKAKKKYGNQCAWSSGGKIYVLNNKSKQLIKSECDL